MQNRTQGTMGKGQPENQSRKKVISKWFSEWAIMVAQERQGMNEWGF